MNKRAARLLVLALFFAAFVFQPGSAETITILHANDTHSCLLSYGPAKEYGGIARMVTLIKRLKAHDPSALVLHAGDVSVGTFEFNKYMGYPELKIMQDLYDAMELGNHEFDLGVDNLAGVLSGTPAGDTPITLPILCANVDLSAHADLKAFVKPYVVKEVNGVKVGIFGVVTPDAQYSDEVHALMKNPYNAARARASTLRRLGCQVVICLSHLGKQVDTAQLSKVAGIDIIVGGHSHDAITSPVTANGKIIVQAGAFCRYLGELKVDYTSGNVTLQSYKLYPVGTGIPEDPTVAATVKVLRRGIELDSRFGPVFTKRVASAAWDHNTVWQNGSSYRDTSLGNLVADALKAGVQKEGYSVDLALEAKGLIGHEIYKGKVVGNDVMRCVPYGYDPTSGLGFKIVVVQLYGLQLMAGLEYTVSRVELDDSFTMQTSGLTFAYDSSKPPAPVGSLSRIDSASVKVDGAPVNAFGLYSVAINEWLYKTLLTLGLEPVSETDTDLFEYDLVADYMKGLGRLAYAAEGRVVDTASH